MRMKWHVKCNLVLLVLLVLLLGMGLLQHRMEATVAYNMDNLIRLHVVANSDSPDDQALKREVRDAILFAMADKFRGVSTAAEAERVVKENLPVIEAVAARRIAENGRQYPVTATLGAFMFPTKSYGPITLPQGRYNALKVVIGKGEGANWWCVLFPPLCFVDITTGISINPPKDDTVLKLWVEQNAAQLDEGHLQELPVEIRFKVVDLLKEWRQKHAMQTAQSK